jgi:hypothetical protein
VLDVVHLEEQLVVVGILVAVKLAAATVIMRNTGTSGFSKKGSTLSLSRSAPVTGTLEVWSLPNPTLL